MQPHHGAAVCDLARRSGMDENSPYAYLMWGEYFADTSVVAERGGAVVGFVTGFRPPRSPDTLFVWQIAVDEGERGRGLGGRMLDVLVSGLPWCRVLEATVTPSNRASASLFRAFAGRMGVGVDEAIVFDAALFTGGGHEPEVRFRIGPFARADLSTR